MNIKKILITSLLSLLLVGQVAAITTKSLTIDPALINQERIAYWLKKRNLIAAAATKQQVDEQVARYIENYRSKLSRQRLVQPSSLPHGKFGPQRAKQQRAAVNKDTITNTKILAILIDFPDLPYDANRLSRGDTAMYYSHYSRQHYKEMLFAANTFTGPNDEALMTSRRYYQQESGGSLNFNGEVVGWYRAQHDASYYGANDSEDSDQNVSALVLEAVNAAVSQGRVNLSQYDQDNDGIIDHLLVIHSSIGEEAGGGVLDDNAIWSHRFYVDASKPVAVVGSSIKVDGYTIQPIDSAAGVVAHEFGHDLGLIDEYDTSGSQIGATVGNWSIMAAGSWLGKVTGTEPNSFSPFAREYLQNKYGGNWSSQLTINAQNLTQAGREIKLVAGIDHQGTTNQIKVELPANTIPFIKPYSGRYQYYSGHTNQSTATLAFSTQVADQANVLLTLQAQWDTEKDYDYVQVLANGEPLDNQYTRTGLDGINGIKSVITGTSPENQWITLEFDLNDYRNTTVNFEIIYVTDQLVGGFGIVIDDITVGDSFANNAESDILNLTGFTQNNGNKYLEPQFYYIQLRNHTGLDKALARVNYSPGVVMWLADSNYEDNDVTAHPGYGFLAVIDADQQMIGNKDSLTQVSDAAFSLYQQTGTNDDDNLDNIAKFDDNNDYSSPTQRESGVNVVPWGITMSVIAQAQDSGTATVHLARTLNEILAKFSVITNELTANFYQHSNSNVAINDYLWNFGDSASSDNQSTQRSPSHKFSQAGRYNVTLQVTDVDGNQASFTQKVTVSTALVIDIVPDAKYLAATFSASVTGGLAPYQYQWDFGDQSALSTNATVTHHYAKAGRYLVTFTVIDSLGRKKIESFDYTVSADPAAKPPKTEEKKSGGGSVPLLGLLGLLVLVIRRVR